MAGERWIFTQEQIENSPSRKCGIDADKETYYRQQAANFIQDMGQRLQVTQLCINTAIVYMHRFYMFHPFTKQFHRNAMAEACLFLAAKVEEQPRKLEHVIKVAHMILHRDQGPLDTKSVAYLEHAQELVVNENILLQTLGFELQVDHPHSHIVKTCNLIRAAKDLAQTSYFLGTNSLHLTHMALLHKPTSVACVCIHLACKWAQFEIPRSNEGKEWWTYVEKEMTKEKLEGLSTSFLAILEKSPSKLKKLLSLSKTSKEEDLVSLLGADNPPRKPKTEPSSTVTSESATTNHEPKAKFQLGDESSPKVKQEHKRSSNAGAPPPPGSKGDHLDGKVALGVPTEGAMRRVKTESYLSLTTKEYFERKEREKQERDRIEKERLKIQQDKERHMALSSSSRPVHGHDVKSHKMRPSEHHKIPGHESGSVKGRESGSIKGHGAVSRSQNPPDLETIKEVIDVESHKPSDHVDKARQHANIFDQFKDQKQRTTPTTPAEVTEPQPQRTHAKEKNSLERSHVHHSYKDKYHEKRAAGEKLPFAVDQSKLRPGEEKRQRLQEQRPEPREHRPLVRHSDGDSRHKGRHPDHRQPDPQLKQQFAVKDHIKPDKSEPVQSANQEIKPPPREMVSKPPSNDVVRTKSVPPPQPEPIQSPEIQPDPEEGEILDDDSPLPPPPKEDSHKRTHSRDSERSHHKHHRERRSSGHRHHSPGSSAAPSGEKEVPSSGSEGRSRHRSPRGSRQLKEELSNSSHDIEARSIAPRYKFNVPEPLSAEPDLEALHGIIAEEVSLPKHVTPEPGEIVEQRSHKHGHHKSSHHKSHKRHKDRDRDKSALDSSSGSLKIKLDLKAVNKTTPTKHSSPAATSSLTSPAAMDDKRELKLKIRSLPSEAREGHLTPSQTHLETPSGLKVKLKLPTTPGKTPSNTPGNGEMSRAKQESKESSSHSRSESKEHKPINPLKLVLSKSSSGEYLPTESGSSHKSHKHSSDKSSRKRPFSPQDGIVHRKLARNDSSSGLITRAPAADLAGEFMGSPGLGSPGVTSQTSTPDRDVLLAATRQIQTIIDLKRSQIQQCSKKYGSTPDDHSSGERPPIT